MNSCIACSMPLDESHGLGTQTEEGFVCQYCLGADGHVRPCEEVFESGIGFFMTIDGVTDRAFAERLTRRNMNQLPYWKKYPSSILEGEEASEEEFYAVLAKL